MMAVDVVNIIISAAMVTTGLQIFGCLFFSSILNYLPDAHVHYSSCLYLCRPGAGKSTVSQAAVQLLGDGDGSNVCIGKLNNVDEFLYIYLDLDVCVPQWMKVSASVYNTTQCCMS